MQPPPCLSAEVRGWPPSAAFHKHSEDTPEVRLPDRHHEQSVPSQCQAKCEKRGLCVCCGGQRLPGGKQEPGAPVTRTCYSGWSPDPYEPRWTASSGKREQLDVTIRRRSSSLEGRGWALVRTCPVRGCCSGSALNWSWKDGRPQWSSGDCGSGSHVRPTLAVWHPGTRVCAGDGRDYDQSQGPEWF